MAATLPPAPPDLLDLLTTLCWDHADAGFDLARDLEKAFIRATNTANPSILDDVFTWLGRDLFRSLLTATARQVNRGAMTMTVYRFGLDRHLIEVAPVPENWTGIETDEHDGLRYLQADWKGV